MRIGILDLNFMTYTYHSTPQASMYTMLISGWHKANRDTVVFLEEYPNPRFYDKVYIIKDRRGVGHIGSWLIPSNVFPVGNYWDKEGIESYYDKKWETAPPDNTIYWGWLDRWKERYQKYNFARLEHFYRTPVKIMQNGVKVFPSGSNLLILDNDLETWDYDFSQLAEQDITNIRFAYAIPIDGRWEEVLTYIKYGPLYREYLFIDMDYNNYTDEEFVKSALIWSKFKLGRMPRLLLNVECFDDDEWKVAIKRIYKALAEFRMIGGKMLRVQPFNIESFKHSRILVELKRWTGRSSIYVKNSLFDYILFDSSRNANLTKEFLRDPYMYTKKKKMGTNKLKSILDFIEEEPELFYIITESYPKAGR